MTHTNPTTLTAAEHPEAAAAQGLTASGERAIAVRAALIDGPVTATILRLAWPAVLATFCRSAQLSYDTYWVGRLGATDLAAMTAASFMFWIVLSMVQMTQVGVNTLVAMAVGAGNLRHARRAALQGWTGGMLSAGLWGVPVWLAGAAIFRAMGLTGHELDSAVAYFGIICLGIPVYVVYYTNDAIFRGYGDTRTPMLMLFLFVSISSVLCPVLLHGYWGIPKLGLPGAPVANLTGVTVAAAVGTLILTRRRMAGRAGGSWLELRMLREMVRIGLPIAASGVFFSGVYLFLTETARRFGSPALAAMGVGHRGESMAYLVGVGFSYAATTLVGQCMGAGRPGRGAQFAWRTAFIVMGWCGLFTVLFLAANREVAGIFSGDPAVVDAGARYLFWASFTQPLQAFELVLEGAFSGAGHTLPPMIISAVWSGLRVPLAHWLAVDLNLGPDGIWIAISATSGIKGALMAYWFWRGGWQRRAGNPGHVAA